MLRSLATWVCIAALITATAAASGPRYVTGPPYFTGQAGVPIGWRQPTLLYSTDPGVLSSYVNHQAADALVAAAAGAWNLPIASITLAQGPALAEDVSGRNVYLSANGVVFPADVSSSNAAAIPLAIIYDADGAVTDTLLGAGASASSSCRQNAVTESVDAFDPAGYILHAILIVNGRCTGPAAEQQLQLQYQLQRAFGRVLGLAWSQANDNVFTGIPTPTYEQALHWPIMHPLDVICGPYTYQCLPSPFTLRSDDIASMALVYPVGSNSSIAGKSPTLAAAVGAFVQIRFPTGEGMGGVNLLAQVEPMSTEVAQPWVEVSAVSGYAYRRGTLSPFVAPDTSVAGSFGSYDQNAVATALMAYVPIVDGLGSTSVSMTSEALNPLYVGTYSVGPYALGVPAPSGSDVPPTLAWAAASGQVFGEFFTVADADAACGSGADGTAAAPVPADPSGWWNGLICAYGHAAYTTATVRAARTFTIEVTALDANGGPTTAKLRPVIGLFAANDAPTALPSLAVAPEPFQAVSPGMTSLIASTAQASAQLSTLRLGIADQRDDGRPDYRYRARFFYGDTVSPAVVGAAGATAIIQGSGFRTGNSVTINGIQASVSSWTATKILVTLPTMAQAGAGNGTPVDVKLTDLETGAVATLAGALTYSTADGLPNTLALVSAQTAAAYTGDVAATPFAVEEMLADGVTPVAGAPVLFSVVNGSGAFSACGRASCTVLTDAHGLASTGITPLAAGTLALQAVDASHGTPTITASFPVIAAAGSMTILSAPSGNVYVTQTATTPFSVQVLSAAASPMPGRSVRFTVMTGSATLTSCGCADITVLTDGNGQAQVQVTPTAVGPVTVRAVDGDLAQQDSFNALSYADTMQVRAAPASGAIVGQWSGNLSIALLHGDGTPDANETIIFSGPAAVAFGACGLSQCTLTTDNNGVVASQVKGLSAGSFNISATFGALVTTVNFSVVSAANRLTVSSLPMGNQVVGQQTTQPFAVLLTDALGNPLAGYAVTFAVPLASAAFTQCNASQCVVNTDANGHASVYLTPVAAGQITVSATTNYLNVSGSFTATGAIGFLTVVQEPGAAGAVVDVQQTFVLKLLGPDGVTPMANQSVYLQVLAGTMAFTYCGGKPFCGAGTDQNGLATIVGTPSTLGTMSLQASWANLTTDFSFPVHAASDVLTVVSAPASGSVAGSLAAIPLVLQVDLPDGVTPVPAARSVTLSVASGAATFQACGGMSTCAILTDAQGRVSTLVTPSAAGTVVLMATEGGGNQTASFVAAPAVSPPPQPDVMILKSLPSNGSVAGVTSAVAFSVEIFAADGVTPAPGRSVTLSVAAGQATLTVCAKSSCVVTTGTDGLASSLLLPTAAGTIALVASEFSAGTLVSAGGSFTVEAAPDMLRISTAPAVSVTVGAATTLGVQALLADGVTPASGKTVSFAVSNGVAALGPCAGSSCVAAAGPTTVITDAQGLASIAITPLAPGSVAVTASEGAASAVATFNATAPPPLPDTITLVSAPTGSTPVGQANATAFAVKLLLGDGSPASGRAVSFAVTAGSATLAACGAATCTVQTDNTGVAATTVTPTAAGSITLSATEVSLPTNSLSATFNATAPPPLPDTITLVSAPTGSTPVGQANATAFAVKLLLGDGSPAIGRAVSFAVTAGSATLGACGTATCTVQTDSTGVAATTVTPTAAGTVSLTATEVSLPTNSLSATFNAAAPPPLPDTITLVSAPTGSTPVGQANATAFAVKLLLGDGSPAIGRAVSFAVTAGSATLAACGAATCNVQTDNTGVAATTVTPTAAGSITLTATEVSLPNNSLSATFNATAPPPLPDTITLVSAPTGSTPVGQANATAFAVKLLLGDGSPAIGRAVSFAVTAGSATLAACGAATCNVQTDNTGVAATTVTPTAAGTVSLTATEVSLPTNSLSATFNALQPPVVPPPVGQTLAVSVSPGASAFLGTYAANPLTVLLTLSDGITPVSGTAVTFANGSGAGQVTFAGCGLAACSVTTDAKGLASTRVLAVAAGPVVLMASAPSPGAGLVPPSVTLPFQVVVNQLSLVALEPQLFLAEAATPTLNLTAAALQNGAPPSGVTVLWQAAGPVQLPGHQTLTLADGTTVAQAVIGPLSGGAIATLTACAWTSICATFDATGVSASTLQVAITNGGWQTLSRASGGSFGPVVAQVTDGAGHPVIGASVAVYQQVTAAAVACPTSGRCPVEPILASDVSVALSDQNGTITTTPLTMGSVNTQTRMAFSAGTQGFATTILTSLP